MLAYKSEYELRWLMIAKQKPYLGATLYIIGFLSDLNKNTLRNDLNVPTDELGVLKPKKPA